MPVNLDKPARWKADIAQSVDMYNDWFMNFAPEAFRSTRIQTTKDVEAALCSTDNMTRIDPAIICEHPDILPTLRMSMCPPLALEKMADPDIFTWLGRKEPANAMEIHRAAIIVADRLCGSVTNPIIRNAQEKRQLAAIKSWLEARGYRHIESGEGARFDSMPIGTFSFRMNVPVKLEDGLKSVTIPVDAIVMPKTAKKNSLPVFLRLNQRVILRT